MMQNKDFTEMQVKRSKSLRVLAEIVIWSVALILALLSFAALLAAVSLLLKTIQWFY
jgi:hypothetical protein